MDPHSPANKAPIPGAFLLWLHSSGSGDIVDLRRTGTFTQSKR
jgi:hypothetical protein